MNRRMIALLLAAALTVSLGGASVLAAEPGEADSAQAQAQADSSQALPEDESAPDASQEENAGDGAADTSSSAGDPASTETELPAEEEPEPDLWELLDEAELTPDPVGSISFANLGSRMRENNFNLLALEENIASIEALDYNRMEDDIRKQLNSLADMQWMLTISGNSFASSSLQSSYDALRDTFDDIRDGELQADNDAVIRQLKNAQDQIVMAGESLYIALVELEMNDRSLDRQRTALNRTVQELELRYDLGQVSALTLQQTKAGRTSLVSGQQTLQMNITNYKTQLEMLIGAEQTGDIQLQELPQVSSQRLADMDLEADLAAAKEASYTLFDAGRTLEDARDDWKDVQRENISQTRYQYISGMHVWEAAQNTYNATLQSFENSFRTLYNQVKDYQQILEASKVSLASQQATYDSMKLKYDQGNISKNELLDAQDDLTTAQETVESAAIDLFSAYNNYRWAVDYGILN